MIYLIEGKLKKTHATKYMEFLSWADVKEINFRIKIENVTDKFAPNLCHITYFYCSI